MPSISKIGLGTRLAVSNVLQIAAFISVLTFVFLREERQALEEVSTGVGERSEAIQADQARHLETLVGDRTRSAADTLDAKGRSLAGLVASAAAPAVRTPDPAVLDEVCRRACRDEDVVLCYVAGADGSILSRFRNHEDAIVRKRFDVQGLESVESTARSMLSSGGVREIQEDVVLDGQRLGRVVLLLSDRAIEAYRDALGGRAAELRTEVGATFDAMRTEIDASVEARTDRALRLAASVAAGFFLIGVVGTYLYSRTIIAPLLRSVDSLGTASGELSGVSEQMSSNAGDVARKANEASAASEHVNRNAETVAAAVEEMSVSIREIARNAANAAEIARSAVEAADSANATVAKLGESGTEIDNVIKVITSIAEQTNLLALNATIEAARAGEAGKGFSVVANEVKELAKETARATEDISNRIEGIQSDTRAAVEAIGRISLIINQISDFQNSIATAVEEQTATTNEIGRSTADTVRMTSEITRYISEVASVSQSTMAGVQRTRQAATALAKTAAELHFLVGSHHGNGAPRPDGARSEAWSS